MSIRAARPVPELWPAGFGQFSQACSPPVATTLLQVETYGDNSWIMLRLAIPF